MPWGHRSDKDEYLELEEGARDEAAVLLDHVSPGVRGDSINTVEVADNIGESGIVIGCIAEPQVAIITMRQGC
jgi:hypothetical protein